MSVFLPCAPSGEPTASGTYVGSSSWCLGFLLKRRSSPPLRDRNAQNANEGKGEGKKLACLSLGGRGGCGLKRLTQTRP